LSPASEIIAIIFIIAARRAQPSCMLHLPVVKLTPS
jgi:hypothetical protein